MFRIIMNSLSNFERLYRYKFGNLNVFLDEPHQIHSELWCQFLRIVGFAESCRFDISLEDWEEIQKRMDILTFEICPEIFAIACVRQDFSCFN